MVIQGIRPIYKEYYILLNYHTIIIRLRFIKIHLLKH